jgi:dTDP-4-dehydrorhamnose 3,5-epimerase
MLKVIQTEIPGVLLIEPAVFKDGRGVFLETFHQQRYREAGIPVNFVQDNHSFSVQGVLRGLHYQLKKAQDKLIYVVRGEIFDVAVDIRRGSPTFGKWVGAVLSEENKMQLFIPKGFAHGFYVKSEFADVMYKCSDVYDPQDDYGLPWFDPDLHIKWPLSGTPLVSEKDQKHPRLKDIPEKRLPLYRVPGNDDEA